ncbi:uncharacterized protein FOBCDRAFT_295654 [Fusarium oxysporum Fo47]|uniref:uncharacterized protein n=1 Tax=Fusarium oxysporum Fo47 TaxID=660027 RepID=UPI002869E2C4|nr:uncharacterized protein FOBCDRAFT_295654 [Fusarium oxysporum Fo47]QKD56904.2 hypothetical protein FOBCDRAFT_295654 [Fusarium oxysporum Fo47]
MAVNWYFDIRESEYGWIKPENTVNVDEGGIMAGFGDVFNDPELRELLTSPPGAISYVLSATSFYLDISASRACDISGYAPSISPRTTDLCSLGCPDNVCGILLLDIRGHYTLTFTFACSLALPRPTTAALAARTTQAAAGCSTFWAPWCPRPRRTSLTWLAALFAARKLHDRSLQSCTAQRPSSSLQHRLLPGTQPGFDNLSHWLRPLDKTAGSKWYRAYLQTVEWGDCLVHRAAL